MKAKVVAPARTDEDRRKALERAMQVRQFRAALRADLKERRIRAVDVVQGCGANPDWAALPALWLLKAVPGIGPLRADRIMERLAISKSRRLQGLSPRQRADLLEELRSR